ncbi:MAG: hypothetical protein IJX77_05690 [Ruminococcus sp.]|nr:hypothetical protein [Ruminococcus sp.]
MIFQRITEDDGWMIAEYRATWQYGYDFMLDAAQTIIESDFQEKLQRVAVAEMPGAPYQERMDDVIAAGYKLRNCPAVSSECSALIIAGESKLMETPVQFIFFNQSNIVRICCPSKEYFEKHGNDVFANYMNSVEIKAYCLDAERQTIKRLSEQSDT